MNKIEIVKNCIENLSKKLYKQKVIEHIDENSDVWFCHLVGKFGLPELQDLRFNLEELEELYIFFVDNQIKRLEQEKSIDNVRIDRLHAIRKKSVSYIVKLHISKLVFLDISTLFDFLEFDIAIGVLNNAANSSDDFFYYRFYVLKNQFDSFTFSIYEFLEIKKNKLQEFIDSFISILKRLKNKNEKVFNEKLKDYIDEVKKGLKNYDYNFRSIDERAAATLSIKELEKI